MKYLMYICISLKQKKMTTIEKLNADLKLAQLKVKVANHSIKMLNAINEKERFSFTTYGMEVDLFSNETLISSGNFSFRLNQFNHFISIGEEVLTAEQVKEVKSLKRSARVILENESLAWNIIIDLARDIKNK